MSLFNSKILGFFSPENLFAILVKKEYELSILDFCSLFCFRIESLYSLLS